MRSFSTQLLLVCLLSLLGLKGWSQIDTTTLTINDLSACTGDTVLVPITVENFNDVTGYQFSLEWDDTKLELLGVCEIAVGDSANIVNTIPNNDGAIGITWVDLNGLTTATLDDNDTLMIFKMAVIDINATGIPLNFGNITPAEIIVFDENDNLVFFTPYLNNGLIILNDNINLQATAEPITCADTIATLSATATNPMTLYSWTGPDNFQAFSADTMTIDTGMYTVIGVDGNCFDTAMVNVVYDTLPPMNLTPSADTIDCLNPSIPLNAGSSTPNVSFYWLDPAQDTLMGAMQNVSIPGTYTLVAENNQNGCLSDTTQVVAIDTLAPAVGLVSQGALDCISDLVTLSTDTTSVEYVYDWQNSAGMNLSNVDSVEVSDPDLISLTVTDQTNGCTSVLDTMITENTTLPELMFSGLTVLNCNVDTLSLSANSPQDSIAFVWLNEAGALLSDSAQVEVTQPGMYNLQGTNSENGCVDSILVDISADFTAPIPSVLGTTEISCDEPTQILQGGSDQFINNFEWLNEAGMSLVNDEFFTVDSAGTYQLLVTSLSNGCDSLITFEVTADTLAPDIIFDVPQDLSCFLTQTSLSANSSLPNVACNWEGFGNACEIFVNQPGTYPLTLTNLDNGCTATDSITVDQVSESYEIFPISDGSINCDNANVSLSVPDTLENVVYTWVDEMNDTISTGALIDVMSGGFYLVQAVDTLTNCPAENGVFVDENITPPTAIINVSVQLDCQVDTVMLEAATGPNVVLEWQNEAGDILADAVATSPGTYFALLTDTTSNCTAIDSLTVMSNVDTPMVALDYVMDSIISCTTTEIMLQANDDPNFEINWTDSNGQMVGNTPILSVSEGGVYIASILNTSNGCTSVDSLEVLEDIAEPDVMIDVSGSINCQDQSATLSAVSPNTNLVFEWQNEAGDSISDMSSITTSEMGTYSLMVVDTTNNCPLSLNTFVLGSTISPEIDFMGDTLITCQMDTVSLNGISLNADVIYEWYDAAGTLVAEGQDVDLTAPGVYSLVGTDTLNFCDSTIQVTITEETDRPDASLNMQSGTITCTDTEVSLTGSSTAMMVTPSWEDDAGNELATTFDYTATEPGTYFFTVLDETSGCDSTLMVEIMADTQAPDLLLTQSGPLDCVDTLATLEISSNTAGVECSWEGLIDDCVAEVNAAGIYTAEVFNPVNGCTSTDSLEVLEDIAEPQVVIDAVGSINCQDGMVELSAASMNTNLVYEWQNEAGNAISDLSSVTVMEIGTYDLVATDTTNNCFTELSTFVQGNTQAPEIDFMGETVITCATNSAVLNGVSPNNDVIYEWYDAAGILVAEGQDVDLTAPGVYSLVGTDTLNFCDSTIQVTITEETDRPDASLNTQSGTITCTDTEVSLTGSSTALMVTPSWEDDAGNELATTFDYTATEPGTYFFTVLDETSGCDSTLMVEIMADTLAPDLLLTQSGPLDCVDTLATLEITSNTAGVECSWEDLIDDCVVEVNAAGIYTAEVFNPVNGCTSIDSIEVESNAIELEVAPVADGLIDCSESPVGLSPDGGVVGNTVYTWTNSEGDTIGINPMVDVDEPGEYTLTIFDSFTGCSAFGTVDVMADTLAPTTMVEMPEQLDCDTDVVALTANPGPNVEVSWETATGTPLPFAEADAEGLYFAIFTDTTNQCSSVDSVQVMLDNDAPEVEITVSDNGLLTCISDMISLSANVSTQVDANWEDANGNSISNELTTSVDMAGTFYVSVTDPSNGCTTVDSVLIQENITPPEVAIQVLAPFVCGKDEAVVGTLDNPDYTYEWTGPVAGAIVDPQQAETEVSETGTYTLVVTNQLNGCTVMDEISLEVLNDIESFSLEVLQPGCDDETPQGDIFVVDVVGGNAPFTFSLDGVDQGQQDDFTGLAPGEYLLSVMDEQGCDLDTLVNILPANGHEVTIEPVDNPVRFGEEITLNLSFDIPESEIVNIVWINQDSAICNGCLVWQESLLENAFYTVLTTDVNGCTSEDQIQVFVARPKNAFMPNAFSPNEDGFNDIFYVQGGDEIAEVLSFDIFDRWGEQVFSDANFGINDPDHGWNGNYRGKPANVDVYVYQIRLRYINGEEELFSGDILLMR